MNLKKLFEMQKVLDDRIINEHGLRGKDLLFDTVLALQVEIGELANEWRGFKYWSKDQKPRREKMLVEYIDCLHFYLSIARQIDFPEERYPDFNYVLRGETAYEFTGLLHHVGGIGLHKDRWTQHRALSVGLDNFFALGTQRLDFTFEEITDAYMTKNIVNHERQTNGY